MSKIHLETFSQQTNANKESLESCLRRMSKIHLETFSQLSYCQHFDI